MSVQNEQEKLREQLEALKIFPNNKQVRELREQITSKLLKFEKKKEKRTKIEKRSPNLSRSSKLKKYHNYIRLIRNHFPKISYSEIRKQFSQRKQGNQVLIPDVIWQNPSP